MKLTEFQARRFYNLASLAWEANENHWDEQLERQLSGIKNAVDVLANRDTLISDGWDVVLSAGKGQPPTPESVSEFIERFL